MKAKVIVIIRYAVTVELYGIIPNKLANKINTKSKKANGKNFTDNLISPVITLLT